MSNFDLQKTIPIIERSLDFFRPHHLELRQRVIKIFIAILCCSAVAYIFAERIAQLFIAPLFSASPLVYKLVYTNLPEAFLAYIKLALLVGIIFAMPVVLYQMWMFVAPGLKKNEKKFIAIVVFWATLLFIGGTCFSFFVVLPKILAYFMSYTSEGLEPLPKLGKYLTFVARSLITFGVAFQIPFLVVMAAKLDFVSPAYFRQKRAYFYGAIIVLSFLLTAGDFMATALLAIPLFALYETGVFLSRLFNRKKG
ncbi:twin-arginine translocase subunit TatC [Desulforhopalus singaporensis]|uniref:Sec-independent protein translocase protein TatC n=1 Tax=Desulforhopalus singaporensis TaxID=91360 RepID=A0A1H0QQN3_9BACT|nr:twin-arginine translocase subunit TatC [Desulforhopalus singaporensis]SDP18998.1 sec-independent protein translocase protein TatC [Desulforhopalus singaporensis]